MGETGLRELLKTNDPVLISFAEALLGGEDIPFLVADQHMSSVEGSIGAIPRRLLVAADDLFRARVLLASSGVPHDVLTKPESDADV